MCGVRRWEVQKRGRLDHLRSVVHPMAATPPSGFIAIILAVASLPVPCLCQPPSNSYYYDACQPLTCGNVTIAFPFTSSEAFCGLPGYEVSCHSSTPTILLNGSTYQVKEIIRPACLLKVSDAELVDGIRSGDCGSVLRRRSLRGADFAPLQLPWWSSTNIISFVCPTGRTLPPAFDYPVVNYTGCVRAGRGDLLYYVPYRNVNVTATAAPCTQVTLPVGGAAFVKANLTFGAVAELLGVLEEGLPLQWPNQTACWDCEATGGRCGYNQTTQRIVCFPCQGGCGSPGSKKLPWKVITATGLPGVFLILVFVASLVKFRERLLPLCCYSLCNRSTSHNDSDVQEFIKTYRSSLVMEYSHLDVKKMTDGFKEKLGEGGCGAVYKGKLLNGQLIAVKILEKSRNNSGQDFVNEVATIGRIHHVNIIRLLGFCCDASHRALIYELMPNGSLGDLISKQEMRQQFGGADLLNIGVGIARGVEYLHQGCDTTILHLDIKPQNVLLDGEFNPKISDFGLAKLHPRRDSFVSLTGARGTVGYIAPELVLSNIGAASHKSDVYSYGMLLLELAVGRKRIQLETENSSKLYFRHWIYDQLEEWRELEQLSSSPMEEEGDLCIRRKMVMVGLWCIQTHPVDRPSITRVLEMLTGRTSGIDLPPKPTLFSMPRESLRRASSMDDDGDPSFYSVGSSWR